MTTQSELYSLLGILLSSLLPLGLLVSSTGNGGAEDIVDVLGDLELAVVPLEVLTGRSSLLGTQRGTVNIVGIGLVRGSVANQGGDLQNCMP